MKTFLKTLLILLVIAMLGGYAYQEGWIQEPQKILSVFDTQSKTVEILTDNEGSGTNTGAFQGCLIVESGSDCTTPWGSMVSHGEAVVSYQINGNAECQTRVSVCNDGEYLADLTPYGLETCPGSTGTGASSVGCQLGSVLVPEGQSLTLYNEPSWDGDNWSCDFGERTCSDGELSGNSEFTQFNCYSPSSEFCTLQAENEDGIEDANGVEDQVQEENTPSEFIATQQPTSQPSTQPTVQSSREPNCPSPFGGAAWTPGQQGTAYTSSQVSFGQSCDPVTIVCAYGSIRYGTSSAPGTIVNASLTTSCEVSEPIGCSSSCGSVTHGETVTTYSTSIIPHGNGQVCDDLQIVSTCSNGVLSPAAGDSCSCQIAAPAGCIAPNGDRVDHESSLTLYQYPQVIAVPGDGSDTCVRQRRQCINGGFYDWNGNRADFTYQYRTCEIVEPTPGSGGGPGGEGIPTT